MAKPAANLFIELRGKVDRLQQDMASAVKSITGLEKRITNSFSTINKVANAALVIGGVVAINKLKNALVGLAEKGEIAGSIAEGFQRLGGSQAQIDKASKAVLGMVDSFDLMRLANEGLVKQIKGFGDNFSTIADLGARLANTLGTDTAGAIQQLTQALVTAAPKQLAQVGIIIDVDKVYKEYAATLGTTADKLSDYAKLQARQIAAQKAMKEEAERLAPVTDSAKNAYDALVASLEEGLKIVGIQINENEGLKQSFRDLGEALKKIDWELIGQSVANMSSQIAEHLASVVKNIEWFTDTVAWMEVAIANGFDFTAATEALNTWKTQVKDTAKKQQELSGLFENDPSGWLGKGGGTSTGASKPALIVDDIEKGAKKAAEEVQKLKEKWTDFLDKSGEDNISTQLDKAIESLNSADFNNLKEQLSKAVQDGFIKEWQDAIKKGAVKESDVKAQAVKLADIQVSEWQTKFEDKSKEAYENSIDTWRSLFENAITGVTFDLESALKQVAVGFAAQMAQAVFGSIGGIKISSPADLGGAIFQSVLGEAFGSVTGVAGANGGGLGSIASGLGLGGIIGSTGMSGAAAQAAGISGPAMASGAFAEGSGLLGFAAANPYLTAALVAGGLAASQWDKIEGLFGAGVDHPQTLGRRDFTGKLEEMFGGGLKFFDEGGKGRSVSDFKFGKTKFNDPNWATKFNASPNAGLFNQVGFALGSVFGTDDLPLEQVGAMLSESLGGSLEGLKALIQSTGVSTEEFTEKLMDAGKKGKGTWLEIIGAIHGVEEAMKEGLSATGDFTGAMQNLLNTGAKGQIALNQVKNIAIEAQEAQVTSLQALREQLDASGKFAPEAVAGLFSGIESQGIKDLESLKTASDRVLAEIVAHMQAQGVKFEDSFKPLNDTLTQLNEMPDTIEKNIIFNVSSNLDSASEAVAGIVPAAKGLAFFKGGRISKFARGGIVSGTTMFGHSGGLGMMGEAGAEGILPLTRVGGKLGVSADGMGGLTINIDARGAESGVEQKIRTVLRDLEGRATRAAYEGVMNTISRGGRMGSSF